MAILRCIGPPGLGSPAGLAGARKRRPDFAVNCYWGVDFVVVILLHTLVNVNRPVRGLSRISLLKPYREAVRVETCGNNF